MSVERWLRVVLLGVGGLVLVDFFALACVHAHTLFAVNQTSGAWLSYAYYFREGVFYPPLVDHGYYAGTRYFPGYFVVHGLLGRLTGELLTSGKLTSYASALLVFGALFDAIHRRLADRALAAATAGIFFATLIGFRASLTIRGDILPLALSLVALTLLERSVEAGRERLWIAAALLAGLAPLAKFTSLHALTAGTLWLFFRWCRKSALGFAGIGAAVLLGGVLLAEVASAGRFSDSLLTTAIAPPQHAQTLRAALETYSTYVRLDRAFLVLAAAAVVALALERRAPSVFAFFVPLHAVIAIGFYLDTGAEQNHLVDLAAGALVLAAGLLAASDARVRATACAGLILAGVIGLATEHRAAWAAPERTMDVARLLGDELGIAGKRILAHDPTIAVLAGQRPVVADDFQYRVLVLRGLVPKDELPRRIEAQEFERIVLLNPPEPGPESKSFEDLELGELPARAIRSSYALERQVGRWYVFRPRPRGANVTP